MNKVNLKKYLKRSTRRFSPPMTVVFSFFTLILIGTALLKLPFATTQTISWLDTLFTATSAVTVTGLIVVDTGTAFTLFGQTIIIMLMQLGGLGLMTSAVFIFSYSNEELACNKEISLKNL